MAMGMEMLVATVIKSLGIDPEVMIGQATELGRHVIGKVQEFDARLRDLENQNAQLIAQNAAFLALLYKAYPEIDPTIVAAPSIEMQTQESE